ncbi:HTH_Tnp_Tc3_2 domain-containing protein [Trichonephila clavipes]|nr:HTH_Tnp_Tc3_2 domain-containing protein [Trichonephila clavipes]
MSNHKLLDDRTRYLNATTGTRILKVTVSKRLYERGLFARRPAVYVPLTSMNRRVRSAGCRQRRDWSMDPWVTTHSHLSLNTDSRCMFIWRGPGTRYLPSNAHEIDNYGRGGLMVWKASCWMDIHLSISLKEAL